MQLSILIPTCNYVCTLLVRDLQRLCEQSGCLQSWEILVTDDGSTDQSVLQSNREINDWPNCRFLEHERNRGKAALLNETILQASYPLILLIDCDAEVCSSDFIYRYLDASCRADVVCGGLLTDERYRRSDNGLRFRYERAAACIRRLAYLQQHPYEHFTTFSVLVHRSVFDTVRFDERCNEYGYEDTLFGLELKRHGMSILHIPNPLIHTGIDRNADYVLKVEAALRMHYRLRNSLAGATSLSRTLGKAERLHLLFAVRLWHRCMKSPERAWLCGRHPSLMVLRLYKLGYYVSLFAGRQTKGRGKERE